jgi:predicted DNA-binding protein
MEVHMELSKKTTILFPPDLHERLSRLAAQKGVSLGELVRSACEKEYGIVSREDRIEAVRSLAGLALPVEDVAKMKQESVPKPEELLR